MKKRLPVSCGPRKEKMMRVSAIAQSILCIAFAGALGSCTSSSIGTNPSVPPPLGSNVTGHYAGTYYPIYNQSVGEWIEPTPSMPFDKVGDIFVAFAHVYKKGNGAVLDFEQGQPKEPARLKQLENVARDKNSHIKVLISLGYGKGDWGFISTDYKNNAGLFVPSVIAFLRDNHLDGFDIDDEDIGGSPQHPFDSGYISQSDFDAVIARLRDALDKASKGDQRMYALVITPAALNDGGIERTNIDEKNAKSFDWVNIQTYFDEAWSNRLIDKLTAISYPASSIAVGVDTQRNCSTAYPKFDGLKGIFNWNMSADSACKPPAFKNTLQIAKDVGYSI
jgi:chitinase